MFAATERDPTNDRTHTSYTPITYQLNGKQYIVIACGGGKMGTKSGDSYVAFALE